MASLLRILAYAAAGIPAVIGIWFVARFAYVTSDTAIDGASNAFLFGMLATGAYAGPAIALAVAANGRKRAAGFLGLLALLAIVANWSHTLAAIAHRGAGIEAERNKASAAIGDHRAELHRLTTQREGMTFTRATAESVKAARDRVAAAERTRIAECGNGDPKQRGPNCRTRETEEQTARGALTVAIDNRELTVQAEALEAAAASIRARLAAVPAVKDGDALGEALARLLPMSATTAATFQQGLVSAIVELLIAAALALPELLRKSRPGINRDERAEPTVLVPCRADVAQSAPAEFLEPIAENPSVATGRFMLARLKPATGAEAHGRAIYESYLDWCSEQTPPMRPMDPLAFAAHFAQRCDRAGIRTDIRSNRVYCLGVELTA